MSYDIQFAVKIDTGKNGPEVYADIGACQANITWNVRKIITLSTGLEWKNEEINGLCIDIIPKIEAGLEELEKNGEKYKKYESPNGWGTVEGTKRFFSTIINDWKDLSTWRPELVPYTYFMIC